MNLSNQLELYEKMLQDFSENLNKFAVPIRVRHGLCWYITTVSGFCDDRLEEEFDYMFKYAKELGIYEVEYYWFKGAGPTTERIEFLQNLITKLKKELNVEETKP